MVALLSILVVVTFAVVEVEIRGGIVVLRLVVLLFEIRVVVGMSVVIPGV